MRQRLNREISCSLIACCPHFVPIIVAPFLQLAKTSWWSNCRWTRSSNSCGGPPSRTARPGCIGRRSSFCRRSSLRWRIRRFCMTWTKRRWLRCCGHHSYRWGGGKGGREGEGKKGKKKGKKEGMQQHCSSAHRRKLCLTRGPVRIGKIGANFERLNHVVVRRLVCLERTRGTAEFDQVLAWAAN